MKGGESSGKREMSYRLKKGKGLEIGNAKGDKKRGG